MLFIRGCFDIWWALCSVQQQRFAPCRRSIPCPPCGPIRPVGIRPFPLKELHYRTKDQGILLKTVPYHTCVLLRYSVNMLGDFTQISPTWLGPSFSPVSLSITSEVNKLILSIFYWLTKWTDYTPWLCREAPILPTELKTCSFDSEEYNIKMLTIEKETYR